MASSFVPTIHHPGPVLRSEFIGGNQRFPHHLPHTHPTRANRHGPVSAKFNLFEILGGRGLLNGEEGVLKELNKNVEQAPQTCSEQQGDGDGDGDEALPAVPENAFEKELMGLTGGFPGGEKGLQRFIEEHPHPPPGKQCPENVSATSKKPNAPELPLLMPGMIAIVKNPNNPFYMYCGIVQRITDGKAGVLFEGGNWDHLITFRLEELERREKGPPMKNPKSAVVETMMIQQDSK